MASVTPHTLLFLRDQGYTVAIVERWNPHAHVRQDLFGFADVVAIHPNYLGVLAVQVTTRSHASAHLRKASHLEALKVWLKAGNRFTIHAWSKRRVRLAGGGWSKVKRWRLIDRTVTPETLEALVEVGEAGGEAPPEAGKGPSASQNEGGGPGMPSSSPVPA